MFAILDHVLHLHMSMDQNLSSNNTSHQREDLSHKGQSQIESALYVKDHLFAEKYYLIAESDP